MCLLLLLFKPFSIVLYKYYCFIISFCKEVNFYRNCSTLFLFHQIFRSNFENIINGHMFVVVVATKKLLRAPLACINCIIHHYHLCNNTMFFNVLRTMHQQEKRIWKIKLFLINQLMHAEPPKFGTV